MITIRVALPTLDRPDAVKTVKQFQDLIDRDVIPTLRQQVKARLAAPPGPVRYPFQFSTARSRRAYFATRGFGNGIPYRRTGDLGRAWKVDHIRRPTGGEITVYNDAPYAGYVYGAPIIGGANQVPGHANTGWGRGVGAELQTIAQNAQALLGTTWEAE